MCPRSPRLINALLPQLLSLLCRKKKGDFGDGKDTEFQWKIPTSGIPFCWNHRWFQWAESMTVVAEFESNPPMPPVQMEWIWRSQPPPLRWVQFETVHPGTRSLVYGSHLGRWRWICWWWGSRRLMGVSSHPGAVWLRDAAKWGRKITGEPMEKLGCLPAAVPALLPLMMLPLITEMEAGMKSSLIRDRGWVCICSRDGSAWSEQVSGRAWLEELQPLQRAGRHFCTLSSWWILFWARPNLSAKATGKSRNEAVPIGADLSLFGSSTVGPFLLLAASLPLIFHLGAQAVREWGTKSLHSPFYLFPLRQSTHC